MGHTLLENKIDVCEDVSPLPTFSPMQQKNQPSIDDDLVLGYDQMIYIYIYIYMEEETQPMQSRTHQIIIDNNNTLYAKNN